MRSVIEALKLLMHRVQVWLYPSHLLGREGKFILRVANPQVLTTEDICVSAKERGGFGGNVNELIEHVAAFFREAAFQMCNGRWVSFGGLCRGGPVIRGDVDGARAPIDPKRVRVVFNFVTETGLRELASNVEIVVLGPAPDPAYIAEVYDVLSKTTNEFLTPGGNMIISGHLIKVVPDEHGDEREIGAYLGFMNGITQVLVRIPEPLTINTSGQIIAQVPEMLPGKDWFIEIRTFYSGSGKPLKTRRAIRSDFTVQMAEPNAATASPVTMVTEAVSEPAAADTPTADSPVADAPDGNAV